MRILSLIAGAAALLLCLGNCKKTGETDDGSGGAGGNVAGSNRCEPLCQDIAASGCENGTDYDGCMITCLALTSSAVCRSSADDYFDCTESSTIACSAYDDPYYPTCGDEWLVAIGCAVTEDPNPAVEQPCSDGCDAIAAASCPNSAPRDECYTNCLWLGATGTGCDDEWLDYLECANDVTMECLLGYAVAPGCGPEFTAYWDCLDAIGN
ncbi:MAG: hypothetical protein JRI23_15580 [Deltaproteobacteria bacterium]|jgi:hypothetical protein|nr:hypothetical protein [Deltaproteobacteria bacterium]MBW2533174.1 hypothetical protein [Deltaproteobacteria bacterium]